MAHPTGEMTGTTLAVYIPSVWGQKINDFFKEDLVFGSFFTDRSSELAGGGNVLITPGLTAMTANSKVAATSVTLNQPTETKVALTVDQWYEVSFAIDDQEAAQVKQSYTLQNRYAQNAGYTIATKLETAIAALFGSFSTSFGASSTNIADSEIRAAIATLDGLSTPGMYSGDVAFFMHPNTFWRQVQNVDKFSLAVNSPVNDPTAKRPTASLYGIPVYVSANVPASLGSRLNVLAHRDAIHFATAPLGAGSMGAMVGSAGVRVQSNYLPDYLHTLTTADILYGVIENRDGAGVLLKSHSTAV